VDGKEPGVHREKSVSSVQEMYLKTLYRVRGRNEVARSRDLAEALGVSPGTVSGVLKKMKDMGLVEHERYGIVLLTEAGVAIAECMLRRFDTIRDVLIEVFGVDPETAAEDACAMEHTASPATIKGMMEALRRTRSRGGLEVLQETSCDDCAAARVCQAAAALAS
jgi:DtxR family Mn-dependent transcriptional regulator